MVERSPRSLISPPAQRYGTKVLHGRGPDRPGGDPEDIEPTEQAVVAEAGTVVPERPADIFGRPQRL